MTQCVYFDWIDCVCGRIGDGVKRGWEQVSGGPMNHLNFVKWILGEVNVYNLYMHLHDGLPHCC